MAWTNSDYEMEKIYKQSLHPDIIEDENPSVSDFRAKTMEKRNKIKIGHNISYKKNTRSKEKNDHVLKIILTIFGVLAVIASIVMEFIF